MRGIGCSKSFQLSLTKQKNVSLRFSKSLRKMKALYRVRSNYSNSETQIKAYAKQSARPKESGLKL